VDAFILVLRKEGQLEVQRRAAVSLLENPAASPLGPIHF
jgi:hypothetical protein